jgi:hypothetical protein
MSRDGKGDGETGTAIRMPASRDELTEVLMMLLAPDTRTIRLVNLCLSRHLIGSDYVYVRFFFLIVDRDNEGVFETA